MRELGPFLLHVDVEGRLLEPPIALPDPDEASDTLRAPWHPAHALGATMRLLTRADSFGARHGAATWSWLSPKETGLSAEWPWTDPRKLYVHKFTTRTVPWTVNDQARQGELWDRGIWETITDYPDVMMRELQDIQPDPGHRRVQGHRGARGLRPENTLPAMEVALDLGVHALETDMVVTADDKLLLCHDPILKPSLFRRRDGGEDRDARLVRDLDLEEIQATWAADRVPFAKTQQNDLALSPVSVAFAEQRGWIDAYTPPDLDALLDFVAFYRDHYRDGDGASHQGAFFRVQTAERVRFNLETKLSSRTKGPGTFVFAIRDALDGRDLDERVDIQSFDFRTLFLVMETLPALRTSFLLDHPAKVPPGPNGIVRWPDLETTPARIGESGGIEGLAITPDGTRLIALLEKPLLDAEVREALAFEYDLVERRFTGQRWRVPLHDDATALGALELVGPRHGIVLERDSKHGPDAKHKVVREVVFKDDGTTDVRTLVDLLDIADPDDLFPGDGPFTFPFLTIESVVALDDRRLLICNDNNLPFWNGRLKDGERPVDTEFIVVRLREPLGGR